MEECIKLIDSLIKELDCLIDKCDCPPNKLSSLAGVHCSEVLFSGKQLTSFVGIFNGESDKPAIIKIGRRSIDPKYLLSNLSDIQLSNQHSLSSGFATYKAKCDAWLPLNVDIIYPSAMANDKSERQKIFDRHYQKSLPKQSHFVRETPQLYTDITKPQIDTIPIAHIKWVNQILSGEKESDRVIVDIKDAKMGFVCVVDSKWKSHPNTSKVRSQWKLDEYSVKSMYLLVIVRDTTIRSLRDLRAKHIPLLKSILNECSQAIATIYNVEMQKHCRVFVHYYPQYYHFHIHISGLGIDYGVSVEKAHLLEDIIQNLEMDSDYYKNAHITVRVFENDPLFTA